MKKEYKTTLSNYSLKKNKTDIKNVKITGAESAADYIRQFYFDDIGIFESFFILMLNNSNNTIGYAKISQGGITGTIVDVRIVAKYAIESLCTSVILAHNHPSGANKPSGADKEITNKLKNALELLDIKILDHLILMPQNKEYYSFSDNGIL